MQDVEDGHDKQKKPVRTYGRKRKVSHTQLCKETIDKADERDNTLRQRKLKSNGGKELRAALNVQQANLQLNLSLASSRGQRRGEGVASEIKRKNCNVNRKKH